MLIDDFEKLKFENDYNRIYVVELNINNVISTIIGLYKSIKLAAKAIRFSIKTGKENFRVTRMMITENSESETENIFNITCSLTGKIDNFQDKEGGWYGWLEDFLTTKYLKNISEKLIIL